MKYSKIVLSGLLSVTLFGISCDKYKSTSPTQSTGVGTTTTGTGNSSNTNGNTTPVGTSPSAASGSGLSLIATPRPDGSLEDQSPNEPKPFKSSVPFIIGKSAVPFGGTTGTAFSSAEPAEVIVPAKVSGKVWGYDTNSKTYRVLSNAQVTVGGTLLSTDSGGNYSTSDTISTASDISASADGYLSTTVSAVSPGENRDIHLQPLDRSQSFNANTISMEFTSLGGNNPAFVPLTTDTPVVAVPATGASKTNYPSIVSFADNFDSRFITSLLNSTTGRYRLEVNPVGNRTTVQGQLMVYDVERDNQGRPTNPTQMKNFIFKKDVTFRVGDTVFPGADAPAAAASSGDTSSDFLLNNFVNVTANFHNTADFTDFVCNAYVVFPTGERLLVSKYTGGSPTKVSFRLPKLSGAGNISYSLEAHAGSASRGSDVVINDMHDGDSVEAYLLKPPTGLTPEYNTANTGTAPTFSWNGTDEGRGYQVEVQSTDGLSSQAWEGFSRSTSLNYPSVNPLVLGSQYRYQVIAMDFSFSRLSILSNKAEEITARALKNNKDLPFTVQLANHDTKSLPKGYRVSYDTVLFRAR